LNKDFVKDLSFKHIIIGIVYNVKYLFQYNWALIVIMQIKKETPSRLFLC